MKKLDGTWITIPSGALMLAPISAIRSVLATYLKGTAVAVSIFSEELIRDNRIQSLMRRALVQSVAESCQIPTDSTRVWEATAHETRLYNQQRFAIHRTLSFRLAILTGKVYAMLSPEVVVKTMAGEIADEDATKALRNAVYGYQHNDVFDADLKHWTSRITKRFLTLVDSTSSLARLHSMLAYISQIDLL